MSLTSSKVLYGPFTLTLLDGAVTKFTRAGLKADSIKFNGETKEGNLEIEDGSEKSWREGRKLTAEITFNEMDPTATTGDLAVIEDSGIDSVTIELTSPSKTITISSPDIIFADIVENFKTRIRIIKTGDLSKAWSDIFSIA